MPFIMPGNQYDDAFALLEKSFNDSSFMKAYQALPVKKHEKTAMTPLFNKAPRGDHAIEYDDDDDDDDDDSSSASASMHEGYGDKVTPPLGLNSNNLSLPPTPPTQSRAFSGAISHIEPSARQRSGLNTPVLQQGPPTPDLTPPNTRDKADQGLRPPRPRVSHYPSSRAESFVTAREDVSVSRSYTSSPNAPLAESEVGRNWLDATRRMRLGGIDLGMPENVQGEGEWDGEEQGEEPDDDNATPTRSRSHASLQDRASNNTLRRKKSYQEFADDEDVNADTENTNLLRNVTIRRKRPKPDSSHADSPHHSFNRRPLLSAEDSFRAHNNSKTIREQPRSEGYTERQHIGLSLIHI